MILVTVIITTKNEAEHIASCLRSIRNQSYPNIEIIVVDNGSIDHTKAIARALGARVFDAGPERSAQRNFGARKSKGGYLLFLDADMILTPKVVEECVNTIQRSKFKDQRLVAKDQDLPARIAMQSVAGGRPKTYDLLALVVPERSFGTGFWAKCKALERSFYIGLDWNTGARFFSKKVFEAMGGYDEANTGTEDFDLPQKIEEKFGRTAIGEVSIFIKHDEGHLSLADTCRKKYYYAMKLHQYNKSKVNRQKFIKQASLFRRYKLYLSKPGILFKNPIIGIGMLFMKTCEFAAGGVGYIVTSLSSTK